MTAGSTATQHPSARSEQGALVVHVTPQVGPQSYGVGAIALGLAKAQRELGIAATIWSTDDAKTVADLVRTGAVCERAIETYGVVGPRRLCITPGMERAATAGPGAMADIMHQHGLWSASSRVSNRWRREFGRPNVIAPHGTLEPLALRNSYRRKRFALLAYEGRNLHDAACLHATSEVEIANFRDFGLRNPIALIPNGVSDDWITDSGSAERFRAEFALPVDRRLMLFLSRITPKKGLPLLLDAVARIGDRFLDWTLVIAGADEFGHVQELKTKIDALGLDNRVVFAGALYGQAKRDAFAAADVCVLPTRSEGAPMVIVESLGAGVPVLTTHGAPWKELEERGCGWWVPVAVDALAEALADVTACTDLQLRAMGERGRALAAASYSWRAAAIRSEAVYSWLWGAADMPDCVVRAC